MDFQAIVETIGLAIEGIGVAVIVIGVVLGAVSFARVVRGGGQAIEAYQAARQTLGRSILLGLELLVAGDIVLTVGVGPTFESLALLAGIILIRTFLSLSLEVELDGRWPWNRAKAERLDR